MNHVSVNPPEHRRQRESSEDRVPEVGVLVPWEQRQLFTQLFSDDPQDKGHGTSRAAAKASSDLAMVEALTEQLAPRLQGVSQWPLKATLYIPRLGRINASVRREKTGWNIELEAEQETTTCWLNSVRQRCEHRLAANLELPVDLRVANSVRT